jgi:FlaG/FlaF family flagellin (archaellin)
MAQSPDDSTGDGEKTESAKPHDVKGVDKNLPMVLAPKLGAGEDDAFDDASEPAEAAVAAAPPAASPRFLMLAATVAFAASFGSFVGSVSGSGFAHYLSPATPQAASENASDTLRATKQELADLSVIKANLDAASRSASSQFAKLADRLDRIDQRTATAGETTGSIAAAIPSSPTTEPAKSADRILPDWVVQDVQNGRALVESRNGGMFDVGAGSFLPGVGRIDSIKRQDGQWIVLTARGTITSGR